MRAVSTALALVACLTTLADTTSVSASLRDGSVIKGNLVTETIAGKTIFLEQISFPSPIIKEIVFSKKSPAKITLTNSDCFAFTPITKSLDVTTVLGNLSIPTDEIRIAEFSFHDGSTPNGLIFHCTFDSKDSIEHPSVGPSGKYIAGDFAEGKHGKALTLEALNFGAAFDLPENFIDKSGCIEFWAKITKHSSAIGDGGDPRFFNISRLGTGDPHRTFWFDIGIVDNDGGGNSGICFNTYYGHVASNYGFGNRLRYFDLLPGQWDDWHHYALSWDSDGIKFGDASVLAVLFIDGKPKSWQKAPTETGAVSMTKLQDVISAPKTLAFTWNHRHLAEHCTKSPFLMDDFKIWNYAKTEFELQ